MLRKRGSRCKKRLMKEMKRLRSWRDCCKMPWLRKMSSCSPTKIWNKRLRIENMNVINWGLKSTSWHHINHNIKLWNLKLWMPLCRFENYKPKTNPWSPKFQKKSKPSKNLDLNSMNSTHNSKTPKANSLNNTRSTKRKILSSKRSKRLHNEPRKDSRSPSTKRRIYRKWSMSCKRTMRKSWKRSWC